MTYYFEVTGPDTAVIIHVKASGSYGGGNAAGANLTISGSEGTILDLLGHNPATAASVDSDFTVNPNEAYAVNLFASANTTADSSITTISTAHIDPLITLVSRDPLGTTLSFSSILGAPSSTITPGAYHSVDSR